MAKWCSDRTGHLIVSLPWAPFVNLQSNVLNCLRGDKHEEIRKERG